MKKVLSKTGVVALTIALSIPAFGGSAQAFDGPAAKNSWGCDNSSKRVNFSYTPGTVTTTVYYNNHCSYTVRAAARIENKDGAISHDCFSIPAGNSSHIKFQQGALGTFVGIYKC
ncbi:hypothetical protein [Streptomyces sp. NBC_00576]|uniref:hypothetical protein n=1 Tax=Streptomyces sp. NBC_00576 TaxID=2903665 RepID=UPI002E8115D9|nr:hypothetical protein [Streptomyces sp. NBC_00576]WUB70679.1 hypothetical protein OG734_11590 [Streptomyces sp. NBC_00576]